MAACKSCGAKIRWAKSVSTGKMIPLDPTPADGGKFGLIIEPGDSVPLAVAAQPHHSLRYDRHSASCPFAGQHRRR